MASVPTTSSPIQAGEPKNISIAKASWKRLTNFRPGWNRKKPYCSVPWHQRWSRRMNSISGRRVLLPAEVFLDRQHAHLVAAAAHQHRLDLVVAQHMAAERALAGQHRSGNAR
jgi:hypothetical protein